MGTATPQVARVGAVWGLLTYWPYLGSCAYWHRQLCCARRLEQHVVVGADPPTSAGTHSDSCSGSQLSAAAPPALMITARTTGTAMSSATAFAMISIVSSSLLFFLSGRCTRHESHKARTERAAVVVVWSGDALQARSTAEFIAGLAHVQRGA